MALYFVRHGETEWNVKKKIQGKTDIPLNENGLAQARALAAELAGRGLAVGGVYSSPQLRAAQTGEIVAQALGVKCVLVDGLREMDLGEWEGSNWDIIKETYGETYRYWNTHRRYTHTPNGESYDEVLKRTFEALKDILAREKQSVLIVSHSAVLMALRCYLAGEPFEEMVKRQFKTKNVGVVEIAEDEIRAAIRRYEAGE